MRSDAVAAARPLRAARPRPAFTLAVVWALALAAACSGDARDREAGDAGEAAPADTGAAERVAYAEGQVISADGIPLAYQMYGEAREGRPALVFVHGWSCDRSYWDGQVEPFAADYRVVALDLAGHGESGRGRETWTIASYGGDVAAVVESLELDRVILIGHSMGGDVVVDAARLLPGRATSMVWVDTYRTLGSPREPREIREFVAPLRADFPGTVYAFTRSLFGPNADSALVHNVATDMSRAPPEVAIPSIESSFSNDRVVPVVLEELDLPVIAINPDDGTTDVEALGRYGVEVVLMPDVGHFPMLEAPERFNTLLAAVIDRLTSVELPGEP